MDFIDLLTLPVKNVSIISYLINLSLVFIFSKFLSILYLKYKITPLIKDEISGNLVYISLATFLLVNIVISSLLLSVALIAFLSIINLKGITNDLEDISYLYLAISLAIGFGANEPLITTVTFIVIFLYIFLKNSFVRKN